MSLTSAKKYFPQLTGVRAIAAYMVFIHHYTPVFLGAFANSLLNKLYVGITVFFVLSGFLIYLRYSDVVFSSKEALFVYFRNRFAKIYPAYFFIALLFLIVSGGALAFFLQITFLRGFMSEYLFAGVAQGWTLTVEECFYAFFPLFLFLTRRMPFFAPLLIIYGVGALLYGFGTLVHFHGLFNPFLFFITYTFFGTASQFFIGMFFAKHFLKKSETHFEEARHGRLTWSSVVVFGISLYLLNVFGSASISAKLLQNSVLSLSIGLFLYGLLTEKSVLRDLLQNKVAVLLGKSSYIFYLIHLGVIATWITTSISPNKLILFILINLLSIFLYYFLEKPCQKAIIQFTDSQRPRIRKYGQMALSKLSLGA